MNVLKILPNLTTYPIGIGPTMSYWSNDRRMNSRNEGKYVITNTLELFTVLEFIWTSKLTLSLYSV